MRVPSGIAVSAYLDFPPPSSRLRRTRIKPTYAGILRVASRCARVHTNICAPTSRIARVANHRAMTSRPESIFDYQ
jgi:hypothetical protein